MVVDGARQGQYAADAPCKERHVAVCFRRLLPRGGGRNGGGGDADGTDDDIHEEEGGHGTEGGGIGDHQALPQLEQDPPRMAVDGARQGQYAADAPCEECHVVVRFRCLLPQARGGGRSGGGGDADGFDDDIQEEEGAHGKEGGGHGGDPTVHPSGDTSRCRR